MNVNMQERIKIYHIIHISKLKAILAEEYLISDAEVRKRTPVGETIGMESIKRRRLDLPLSSRPGLNVGECVPFYFCPRSVMLYMFHRDNNPDIEYHGGQEPILHLVADMKRTIEWLEQKHLRWAFTNTNAGSSYFEDFIDLNDLGRLDWDAIRSSQWKGCQDKKQAEFLVEERFPWELVEGIGVYSFEWVDKVNEILENCAYKPLVKSQKDWYF